MKFALLQSVVLAAVVVATGMALRGPAESWWGAAGVTALHVAASITLATAILAATLFGLALAYRPTLAPQAAFAGTAVRLLGTMMLAVAVQVLMDVQLDALLTCLVVFYLTLLVFETGLAVVLLRRNEARLRASGE